VRTGGWVKHIQICLCLAQSIFFELPRPITEATEFQATTKRGEEAPRLAVRTEKRATKNVKIRLLFSETETAKQNQKFPFHFLSAPPTPPAENLKLRKENFWFLLPRPKGADEARRLERTIQFRFTTHAGRATSFVLEVGASLVQ